MDRAKPVISKTREVYLMEGFMDVIAAYKVSSLDYNSHAIDFDIAVTSSESGTAKGESKIGISVLGANINGERGYNNEHISRIKFSIPFYPEYINED